MDVTGEKQDALLGFLGLYESSTPGGYVGAILITDLQGVPQEFRCTHPVKPTAIQKPLYGDALEPYIGVELCGVPLLESIQNKPSLIVVHKEFLIQVRAAIPYPVAFVRRAGEAVEIKASDGSEISPERERIDCATGRFQPIVFTVHPDFDDDKTCTREILDKVFSYLDPIEPFERIRKAIEVLGKQDERFR